MFAHFLSHSHPKLKLILGTPIQSFKVLISVWDLVYYATILRVSVTFTQTE